MQENSASEQNKTLLALAGLMFFAPFVQHALRGHSIPLSEQEQGFVEGYIRLGYVSLLFLFLSILGGVGNYFWGNSIIELATTISMGILLVLLLLGSIAIVADISLSTRTHEGHPYYQVHSSTKNILLFFLPGYSVYAWYQAHDFLHPTRWIKEALLRWTVLGLLAGTGIWVAFVIVLLALVFRVATLLIGIDFLHLETKEDIGKVFTKNPEEIWGYLTGSVLFLLRLPFPRLRVSYTDSIQSEKLAYSLLYPVSKSPILWEYLIGALLLAGYVFWVPEARTQWGIYVSIGLLLLRYLPLLLPWKHLPHLPLAREIKVCIITPFRLLFSLFSHHA